ncbi:hypothetical protein E4T39_01441 [Aureobasidium subglaciale]|nr:hypothetical protein E4T39_01441 [Aureobasidium subglaciale]
MKSYALPLAASFLSTALAASHSIDVGEGGLVFSPNSTTAAVGDTVTFHFYPRAHGVARSSYSSPCAAMDNGGFNSDFVMVASGESATTFTITVNDTQPIWYYCPQGDHCQAGMVGVINPPSSSDQTIGGFIIAASSAGTSTVPNGVYGGVIAANGAAAAGGSSSSVQSASSSMSSSMMASSMMSSSMMSSSSRMSSMASSMASSAAVVGSSSLAMSGSSTSTATGSASRTTSGAASGTSSVVASTGAASSFKSVGMVEMGLGFLFGGLYLM